MGLYEDFIALSRYARYIPSEERRETWTETVQRYFDFFEEEGVPKKLLPDFREAQEMVLAREIMPSMRCLMTAGPALSRDNVAGYNCAYSTVESMRDFDEALYTLMCGTGLGYSIERQYIQKLPEVSPDFHSSSTTIHVHDSKVGWAKAFRQLLALLWAGEIPKWDLSDVRPAGARLKTFGGRASGPAPLEDLFEFTTRLLRDAAGRKLNSIECHDLMCKIAQIVVVGGVRRSALISLSNLSDRRMARAKEGEFYYDNPQRSLANNSVAYTEKPDFDSFLEEWVQLHKSKSGERGVFNRQAAKKKVQSLPNRDPDHDFGCNPCSEIILRPHEFCNLSEVVIREHDNVDSLSRKVQLATLLGTLQSTLTSFRYLRKVWKTNTEEERLLGVSFTGIMDNPRMYSGKSLPEDLLKLRDTARKANSKQARELGIPESAAITCVKPSGTVSQLVNSSSGIHARYSEAYIRRVRADDKDPLAQWMIQKGFPHEDDEFSPGVKVFEFPVRAPKGALTEQDISAKQALEIWKVYNDNWCDHKPSCTVHYKDDEFLDIGQFVWENFDSMSGVSFLPLSDHVYKQAPYEACSDERIRELEASLPDLDLAEYREVEDNTSGSQELACTAGVCEVVDLT